MCNMLPACYLRVTCVLPVCYVYVAPVCRALLAADPSGSLLHIFVYIMWCASVSSALKEIKDVVQTRWMCFA